MLVYIKFDKNPWVLGGSMKKVKALVVLMILASFTLFAEDQHKGFVANVSTGTGFDYFIATVEATYHPFEHGGFMASSKENTNYYIGMEDSIKAKTMSVKSEIDSYVFNPDEIPYKPLKYKVLDPFGYGSANSYFERAALLFALRYYYDGMTFRDPSIQEPVGLLAEQNFFPNGDRRYANRLIITTIAKEIIAELTIDQIVALQAKRDISKDEGYIPLANRTVDEVYNAISIEHDNKGFDFLVYPADIEAAAAILKGTPTLQEKMIEAKRQKLISYVKWTYTLPRTMEALRILSFVLAYEGLPDVGPALTVNFAREIAEWRLANSDGRWQEYLVKSMSNKSSQNVSSKNWADVYLGVRTNAYSSIDSDAFVSDAMGKLGFGYNIGDSFVYLTGYVGLPVDTSDVKYEAALNTNIRITNFFELHTDAYYYDDGRLRGVVKPNFIILNDLLQVGGGVDFDILPSMSATLFGEVFVKDTVGVGIGYDFDSKNTSLSATIKF